MQDAVGELFRAADIASEQLARLRDAELQDQLRALQECCEEAGRAWSGSNIGYHAAVYYEGLKSKPPNVQFSPEWGLMERWPTGQGHAHDATRGRPHKPRGIAEPPATL